MDITSKIYPSKILLFGEYTVIHGGDSLAIPYYKRYANWDFDLLEFESRKSLLTFVEFIENKNLLAFDGKKFKQAWEAGLFLDSNIPIGYGAGSSGSLVAAFYDTFGQGLDKKIHNIQRHFQNLEAHFHGTSSGIDPLVAYLNKAIWRQNKDLKSIETADLKLTNRLFLWDSKVSRKTEPLVNWYKNVLQRKAIPTKSIERLKSLNTLIIKALLENNESEFEAYFEEISTIQEQFFTAMFPPELLIQIHAMKVKYPGILFKLCGAGGGGYYLAYVPENCKLPKNKLLSLTDVLT